MSSNAIRENKCLMNISGLQYKVNRGSYKSARFIESIKQVGEKR